jgi:hypothetical protein
MSTPGPTTDLQDALPPGLRLDEFEIRSVIGVGGFGIVYHAFDHALERDVALKEYMPGALASRSATLHVSVRSQGHAETFAIGLRSFVNEARLLARFDHPSLVKVHRFWEAHGTAYMVMPLYRGRTLKALRQSLGASPSEHWLLRALLEPLLGALETLHREGVFHRDVSPDNILVTDEGRPVLLDFGAARHVIADQTQTLTAIVKPNFAPIEQYGETEGLRQGPWTDLYALGATLHFVITGQPPLPATARALGSGVETLAGTPRRGLSPGFLQVVDWMMAPRPEQRPQSVAALREVLAGRTVVPAPAAQAPVAPPADDWERTVIHAPAAEASVVDVPLMDVAPTRDSGFHGGGQAAERGAAAPIVKRRRTILPLTAALLVVASGAAAWVLRGIEDQPTSMKTASTSTAASMPAPAASVAAAPSVSGTPLPASSLDIAPPASAPAATAGGEPEAKALTAVETTIEPRAESLPLAAPTAAHRVGKRATKPAPSEPVTLVTAPVATTPAPESSPGVTVENPASLPVRPRDQCRDYKLLAWYRCVKRACEATPAFSTVHECQRVRQIEVDNFNRATQ